MGISAKMTSLRLAVLEQLTEILHEFHPYVQSFFLFATGPHQMLPLNLVKWPFIATDVLWASTYVDTAAQTRKL